MGSTSAIGSSSLDLFQTTPVTRAEAQAETSLPSETDDTSPEKEAAPPPVAVSSNLLAGAYVLAQDYVNDADSNHDGTVSRREFIEAYGSGLVFSSLGGGKDGQLSVSDLAQDILGTQIA